MSTIYQKDPNTGKILAVTTIPIDSKDLDNQVIQQQKLVDGFQQQLNIAQNNLNNLLDIQSTVTALSK